MIRWLARFMLLRVLPRRLVPLLTVVEVAQLLRAARRQRASRRGQDPDRWADDFAAHRDRTGASVGD
ncbi:MAG TPA: hypothetical protein VGK63_05250 [Candidatus Limnocylindrales bacterium]